MPVADTAAPPAGQTSLSAGRAARTVGWAVVSLAGSKLVVFVTTLAMARLLVPEQFGVVAAGLTLIALVETGLDLGVGAAVVYEQETGVSDRIRTAFTLNLLVAAVLTVTAVTSAPLVAALFGVPDDVLLLQVLFGYLLLRGAGQVPDAVLRRDLRFKRRAVVEISRAGVRAVVSIGLAVGGAGAWSLVGGLLAGELVGTVATWWAIRFVPRLRIDRSVAATLLRFGGAVLAIRLLTAVGENADYVVVGNRLGPEDLGLYLLAVRVPELFLANIYWIVSSVAFSLFSRVRAVHAEEFGSVVLRALRLITVPAFAAAAGLVVVAEDLTGVLLGDTWAGAAGPMALIALAMGVSAIAYASGDVFPAIGRPGVLARVLVPVVLLRVLALLAAAPHGLVAIAGAQLVVSVVNAVVRLVLVHRLVRLSGRALLGALVPGAVTATGALLGAVPVTSLMAPGPGRLAATVVAGAGTAVLLLRLLAPAALDDIVGVVRSATSRQAVR